MMMTGTTLQEISATQSWYGNCKYYLPCGYCELKKKDCDRWQTVVSIPFKPDFNWNEVTCSTDFVTSDDIDKIFNDMKNIYNTTERSKE